MRLDNEPPSENVEDRRGQGGFGGQGDSGRGFGFPGSERQTNNFPMGSRRGGFSISTLIILVIVYFAMKLIFGIDLLAMINGGRI